MVNVPRSVVCSFPVAWLELSPWNVTRHRSPATLFKPPPDPYPFTPSHGVASVSVYREKGNYKEVS
jgi:hypothetical protein